MAGSSGSPYGDLEGDCEPLDTLEDDFEHENDDIKDENSFQDAEFIEHATQGRLEDWLVSAVVLQQRQPKP